MKKLMKFLAVFFVCSFPVFAQIAVTADTIYTMAGENIAGGIILISDGKIELVGMQSAVTIPDTYRMYHAKVVTPGLIDAHSVVGLAGILNYSHDQDQLEKSDAVQPELRAIDAYNRREDLVEWVRNFGVTTIHTGHGPGALASGQTMIVKTFGENLEESILDSAAMIAFTLGPEVSSNYKKPGTRSKGMAMLRQEFFKAKEYKEKLENSSEDIKPPRDLKLEALADVLSGRLQAMFSVNTAVDIMSALRLGEEFGFKPVIDGAAEAYLLIEELKSAGVEIILHPTMKRNYGTNKNISFGTAAELNKEGIKFSLQSGYESYVPKTRVVLFEAALANANGLSFEDALASITIDAAEILGIDNRVGSIEPGKDADLVLYDGNPFEYTTHVCEVFINGKLVKEGCN